MIPQTQSEHTRKLCALAPVIPVLVIDDAARAEKLGEALIAGGLPVLEVTLRTPAALDAIKLMAKLSGGHVGAGTVLTPEQVYRAKDAGASFAVAPGATETLIRACEDASLPLLPGAVTASEVMQANEYGYDMLKFFPASTSGGAPALKALAGPLPHVTFCPTGGVTPENANDYLSLPNVICVGSSWVAPGKAVAEGDWSGIEARAREAAQIRKG
ncbi:MAG TPA: bifunctional 4-hydroxy-2-oxoglutarate aldolase/2-dehydro-3-deoxy-phosphogluconate aldolase [Paracoccus sp. (in: a-proteobacteria)]|uniref:bifunctional 4-hydroxy-2-oxoglutarate aldolase/2-dehydro-3-deoxy-phosphogluconate aldolase n=1 Tax=uncultured Paracoccus sp. TaxID=189685 RepID=UPI00262FD452|nr:bifunctional 4-hydroxy-2-oxoglutarate aldolase/2-dehydro-3-deoxy-phosphogluconate aldolase [uncultured Paracoccus sp.]HMQ39719.1 bifunctional 4-hydroxy-2-oxoglutarate aldolase/2-dehydro-3-deoxy-phosphogluconate aldolase [Paracoccus sp. (in: a-proteobacteria)]HMR34854.1 bifunctional 4-hydroxy-2-oxoglutarate aldolase/2-dehydro-3-deoxy-phosphogluconate aldolase [Paracoccus sp. (in: a-proteobacteria)]